MKHAIRSLAFLVVLASALPAPIHAAVIEGAQGKLLVTTELRPDGHADYRIERPEWGWRFAGALEGISAESAVASGTDGIGAYREVALTGDHGRRYSIRVYAARPVVLFAVRAPGAPARELRFPELRTSPAGMRALSYRRENFAPYAFDLSGDAPWVFFDANARAFVLSPASHFMIAGNARGADGTLSSGIESQVAESAGHADYRAILALDQGINRAFESWGSALTGLAGKQAPANDADATLAKVGYWTDNRGSYWYNSSRALGYEGTLLAIQKEFAEQGIPLGHLQLDSWWYVKGGDAASHLPPSWQKANYGHGIYEYKAPEDLFAHGLADFQGHLGVPLITHSRWVDETSPYRQRFRMSGGVSTDPAFWDEIMSYLQGSGVEVYEQDWLNEKAMPRLDRVADGDLFLDGMAQGARDHGLGLQYCMALPRHFLQGSKYSNLRTIRVNGDGFERGKWTQFLFGSRLASSLGIWPWVDVFFSQDRDNLLLATLSAGIVGVGDHLSPPRGDGDLNPDWCKHDLECKSLNAANLRGSIRADGVVVKPDTSLQPIDQTYLIQTDPHVSVKAMVSAAFTRDSGGATRAAYVFAYGPRGQADARFTLSPGELGIPGDAYLYSYFDGTGRRLGAGVAEPLTAGGGGHYWIAVPIESSGLALLGDAGQYVTLGRKRVEGTAAAGRVTFVEGEREREIMGYSAGSAPRVLVEGGSAGPVSYDAATGVFRFALRRAVDRGTQAASFRIIR